MACFGPLAYVEPAARFCYNPAVIIDFHTHIFPPRVIHNRELYIQADPCFAELYSQPNAKLASAEELIASMDSCDIDMSVIANIGWTKHELCVETNDYILENIARYPKRLLGLAAIQPGAGEKAQQALGIAGDILQDVVIGFNTQFMLRPADIGYD